MRNIITISLLLSIISCGLNPRLEGVSLTGNGSNLVTTAVSGANAGSVQVEDCTNPMFTITSDPENLFAVDGEGNLTINQDNPPAGTYPVGVSVSCEEGSAEVVVNITVQSVDILNLRINQTLGLSGQNKGVASTKGSFVANCNGAPLAAFKLLGVKMRVVFGMAPSHSCQACRINIACNPGENFTLKVSRSPVYVSGDISQSFGVTNFVDLSALANPETTVINPNNPGINYNDFSEVDQSITCPGSGEFLQNYNTIPNTTWNPYRLGDDGTVYSKVSVFRGSNEVDTEFIYCLEEI